MFKKVTRSLVIGGLVGLIGVPSVGSRPLRGAEKTVRTSGERKRNNLVADLLDVASISKPGGSFAFARRTAGWIFVSATFERKGAVRVYCDKETQPLLVNSGNTANRAEGVRQVAQGNHTLRVECDGDARVSDLNVRAIPELMHCGLGFNPAIKAYGPYDLEFLKRDILPNITTLVVPSNIALSQAVIDNWHRQGKKFVGTVGVSGQAQTADEHFKYWTGFLDKAPYLDGILIDEFIINQPSSRRGGRVSPERQKRREKERLRHRDYEAAFKKMRADRRYQDKMLYAYIGGSGKTLNQEVVGPTFIHTLIDCDYRIALERYLHEMSSEKGAKDALQLFVDGIADWAAKEPDVKRQMVIAFGLFSMPPGGINKQPNVDYHVWMDQQMNVVANHPTLDGIGGLEWWTSLQADEETVRFVGRLYRHYAIEGKTDLLTRDPLFLPHLKNADFEKGTADWTLHAAEEGSIQAKSFPRYGRIEGRYMGLGRPADPEHIGDTFLLMKRTAKGPNTFSQTVENLEPGRLYSLKMFSCDYQDLLHPKAKKQAEALHFIGKLTLEGVDVDTKKTFAEAYASGPEPPIPVWITYHWIVFRAKAKTARLTVSDWPSEQTPQLPFGQEQTFNFLELEPYHE